MFKIPAVKSVPAQMVAINRAHDLFMVQRENCQIFFTREANGQINVIWEDPNVRVISLGSAKQRRALYARAAAHEKRRTPVRRTAGKPRVS
jgi:hypothetical protein